MAAEALLLETSDIISSETTYFCVRVKLQVRNLTSGLRSTLIQRHHLAFIGLRPVKPTQKFDAHSGELPHLP